MTIDYLVLLQITLFGQKQTVPQNKFNMGLLGYCSDHFMFKWW